MGAWFYGGDSGADGVDEASYFVFQESDCGYEDEDDGEVEHGGGLAH